MLLLIARGRYNNYILTKQLINNIMTHGFDKEIGL